MSMTKYTDKHIFQRWKSQWSSDFRLLAGKDITQAAEEVEFLAFFEEVYMEFSQKSEGNRKKNFRAKRCFAFCAALCALFQIFVVIVGGSILMGNGVFGVNAETVTLSNLAAVDALLLLTCGLFLTAISKWTGIKKYQETWARHAWTAFRYKYVMLRYLQRLKAEDGSQPSLETMRETFKADIFNIMSENYKKFIENMENKEINLMEDMGTFLK